MDRREECRPVSGAAGMERLPISGTVPQYLLHGAFGARLPCRYETQTYLRTSYNQTSDSIRTACQEVERAICTG